MIDLLIVLAFIAYAIYSGISSKDEAGQDLKEYFLAGRSLSGTKAGMSMAATQFAADTPLLVTGLIATGGVFLLWRLWIYGISFLVIGFIFSTKWRRSDVITDAELTTIRYSGKHIPHLRFLKAFYYGTVINCVVLAMVLVAAMRIAEVFLPWHEWLPSGVYSIISYPIQALGIELFQAASDVAPYIATTNSLFSILIIVTFTTMYSTTGGLRSVVATDMVQFLLAMVGTGAYAIYILINAGGFSGMISKLEDLYGAQKIEQMTSLLPANDMMIGFFVLVGIQWLFQMNSDGTGYLAQRSMACRTDKDARLASVIFTWAQVVLRSVIWVIIALGLLVIYPYDISSVSTEGFTALREMTFVQGIQDLLPPGIKGLMLVGLLGALASTIDTHLNWGASYWSNDIYQDLICRRIKNREASSKELVWVARLSNILIPLVALVIMFNLGSIQKAWQISLLFGAGMGGVLVLRWVWERITIYSEISAIITSIIFAPIILNYVQADEWVRLTLMATLSTIIPIVVAFVGPKTDKNVLKKFYKQIEPQGLWKLTASECNEDGLVPLKKLKASSIEILLICVSLYSTLIGLTKLIMLGFSGFIWWFLLIFGLALIPIWKKKI